MSLGRSALLVTGAAAISRVLGFVRDILIAALFGAGPVADALLLALRIPNLIRRVLGEGGLNAGFVPIYARLRREGAEIAGRFASTALTNVGLATLAVVAVCHIAAPLIIRAFAGGEGFAQTGGQMGGIDSLALATSYLRASLPFVVVAVLATLIGAWLNAERRFIAASLAPLAVNVVLIMVLVLLLLRPVASDWAGLLFAASWTLAGLAQLVFVLVAARGLGLDPSALRPRLTEGQRSLLARALPAVAASGAAQIIVLAATYVASFTPGGISWLYYADRLVQFPLGFVAVAVGIVLLPEIALRRHEGDDAGANAAQNRALEAVLVLSLPAAAALIVLAVPIVGVLFERRAFGDADTMATAAILAGLAPGLVVAAIGKVLSQTAFASERLALPLAAAAAGTATTLGAGILLAQHGIGPVAVGLSVTLGLMVHALVVGVALWREGRWRPDRRLAVRLAGLSAAASGMALALWPLAGLAGPFLSAGTPEAIRLAVLGLLCIAGLALFGGLALLLRVVDPRELRRMLTRG